MARKLPTPSTPLGQAPKPTAKKPPPPKAATVKATKSVKVRKPAVPAGRPAASSRQIAKTPAPSAGAPRGTKLVQLIAQLRTGSTMAEMTALTGWQAHSVRGAISGILRKKMGLKVTLAAAAAGGARRYRLEEPSGAHDGG